MNKKKTSKKNSMPKMTADKKKSAPKTNLPRNQRRKNYMKRRMK